MDGKNAKERDDNLTENCVNVANNKQRLIADDGNVPSIFPRIEVNPEKRLKTDQYSQFSNSRFCMDSIRKNDELIELYTGFKNYDHLNSAFRFLFPESNNNSIIYFNANSPALLEADCASSKSVISPENAFLMTLMKLRLGLATSDLAFRFNVSSQLASTILTTWINYMYNRFSRFMIWPSRTFLLNNTPEIFASIYPGVIAVVSAVQLSIDCSRSGVSAMDFSNCKCLIVCDPNGAVLYTSQMYQKSISYKDLARQCGLLELLKALVEKGRLAKGDIILLESVIDISDDLESLDLRAKFYKKLNDADDRWPTNTNRGLGAIKRFSFFDGRPIPFEMLDLLDQMWTSVCFLTSLIPLQDKTSTKLLL